MDWAKVAAVLVTGAVAALLAYGMLRLANYLDGPIPNTSKLAAIGRYLLAAIVYVLAAALFISALLTISMGLVGTLGIISGWSSDTTVNVAVWLAFGLLVLTFLATIGRDVWRDYFRHLLPGSARGTAQVKPASNDPQIRKRWARAERLDAASLAIGTWIITTTLIWALPSGSNVKFAIWFLTAAVCGALAVSPRLCRAVQYRNGIVVRANPSSPPDEDTLREILIPRAIMTPLLIPIVANIILKTFTGLPDGLPLAPMAAAVLSFAMAFPLTMSDEATENHSPA